MTSHAYCTSLRREAYLLPTLIYRPRQFRRLGCKTLEFRWLWWRVFVWWADVRPKEITP
jgi:hypothetical protein